MKKELQAMRMFFIARCKIQKIAIFGVVTLLFSVFAMPYWTQEAEIEQVDMSILAGHTIILDPGHGGVDSGAASNHVVEKEINLAMSAKLANVLQTYGVTVLLTRDSDIDYYTRGKGGKRNDLLKRIDIIENSGAEMFISLHCNAFAKGMLSGAQVFYSPKFPQSKVMAHVLQRALKEFPPGNKRQAKEDVRILIINGIDMPGVLIESGYVTNQQEAALLVDESYQQKLVESIAKCIAYHFSHPAQTETVSLKMDISTFVGDFLSKHSYD